MGLLESPWSQKVMIHWEKYSDLQDIREKQGAFCYISKISQKSLGSIFDFSDGI